MYGIIYKATNNKNGKVYIGQTIDTLVKRKNSHKNPDKKRKKSYFYNSIKKYGWENFEWEILEYCDSKDELDQTEIFYIWFYCSLNKKYGYNIRDGGARGKQAESSKKKSSKSHKGLPVWNKGKKLENHCWCKGKTKETCDILFKAGIKISKIRKEKKLGCGSNNGMYGKHHTKETKLKLKEKKFNKSITIEKILELQQQGFTQIEIAIELFCSEKTIRNRLKQYKKEGNIEKNIIDNTQILKLLESGLNYAQIAKELSCSPPTIRNRLKKMKENGTI
jgi:group I intron endonuclease